MTSISTFNIPHTQWINHVSYRMWTESSAAWFGVMISLKKPECLLVKGWLHVQVHIHQSVSSVAQLCPTLRPHGLQHARLPCPSPTPRACSDSRPMSWWCHPTLSSSVVPFSSCLQSFPTSGSFPVSITLHHTDFKVSQICIQLNALLWKDGKVILLHIKKDIEEIYLLMGTYCRLVWKEGPC